MPGIDEYTKLLLHFNGDFTDSATEAPDCPHTVRTYGDVAIDSSTKKYGSGSGTFDGTGDYIKVDASDDWKLGSGDFTLEAWVYPTDSPSQPVIVGLWGYAISWCLILSNDSNRYIRFLASTDGTNVAFDKVTTTALALNDWSHVAAVRYGNTLTLYVNGSSAGTQDMTGVTLCDVNMSISVGATESGGVPFEGKIDELRISKGIARWTADFSGSLPTEYGESSTYDKSISEGVKLGDTFSATSPQSISEGVKLGDTFTAFNPNLSISEGAKLGDTFSSSSPLPISEGVKMSDSFAVIGPKIITEGIKMGDLITVSSPLVMAETVNLGDVWSISISNLTRRKRVRIA